MRWLITGGCGFIGRSLVEKLVAEGGHTIRVLDNLSAGTRRELGAVAGYRETPAHDTREISNMFESGSVELIEGDVRDMALALRVAEGAEAIVHLAAANGRATSLLEPRFDCDTTVSGTLNMLEAARHCDAGRFVLASCNAAHGEFEPGANGQTAPQPASPHGAAKLAAEAYCSAFHRSFAVPAIAVRIGSVYGPGDTAGVVARFAASAVRGGTIEIHGDGRQIRDFVYVDDAAGSLLTAARDDIPAGAGYQVSGGEETSVAELIDLVLRLARHADAPPSQVVHGPAAPGSVAYGFPGASSLPALPGWTPETNFATGIGRTLRWHLERREVRSAAA